MHGWLAAIVCISRRSEPQASKEVLHHMSPCNRRAAAAAAIGVLAGVAPVGAAGAAPNHGPSPVRAPGGSDHRDQGNGTDLIPANRRSVDPPPEPGANGP